METPETIAKTWMRRVWNELDVTAIDDLLAPDALVHGIGETPMKGPADWKQFHSTFASAFSGIHLEILDQVVNGDTVAARFQGSMTHKGTNKAVTVHGMIIARVRDGQIVEGWNAVDFMPMLATLGLVPGDAMNKALMV